MILRRARYTVDNSTQTAGRLQWLKDRVLREVNHMWVYGLPPQPPFPEAFTPHHS